ncbi:fumarylacetoacetate hydrolase family protein [Leisingera sp. M527]|uniref:fumarylacetoacetate hydrolase family protein n=1 Tax=Leisingera sp. M527 TaxID=2867014 RepID=UPI0021A63967|nr:fumarylacetoacetate hydrolase family protein [Leisingera sp. M527]UWQ33729.1 fumarylacetoacetate hydrolase family protein [Leisingera sp. M527]
MPLTTGPQEGTLQDFLPTTGFAYAFGLAYADHIRETGSETPETPIVFLKNAAPKPGQDSVAIPAMETLLRAVISAEPSLCERVEALKDQLVPMMDFEIELGVQLLEDCTLSELQAAKQLPMIGYFLANDVTSRTVQMMGELTRDRYVLWSASKSYDGFFPCGRTLWVPDAEARDLLPAVRLELKVNGKIRQSEPVSSLIYTPRQILEGAAAFAPDQKLRAGDLIVTGTPAGVTFQVSAEQKAIFASMPLDVSIPKFLESGRNNPDYLKPGDLVEMDAEWLGQLTFTMT